MSLHLDATDVAGRCHGVIFEILKAVLLNIRVFLDVSTFRFVSTC